MQVLFYINKKKSNCYMCLLWFLGFCVGRVCIIYGFSSFANILTGKKVLVTLLLLSFRYLVTKNILWLFLTVSGVALQL